VVRWPFAFAALLAAVSCSVSQPRSPSRSPSPPPTRPAPAMVQVEDAPASRPQRGLQQADLVYEYLTEGGISRFTVLYWNPSGGFRVEPVRSARLVTLRLVQAYGSVLFYSGASDHVQAAIGADHLPALSESSDGGRCFARDRARAAPHNLYTTGDQLQQCLGRVHATVSYPPPPTGELTGQGESATRIDFAQTVSQHVTYTYAPGSRTYTYADEQGPLTDAGNGGQPVAITTVVLVRVAHHDAGYTEDVAGAEGIDFDLSGNGAADVYTRGRHLTARWDLTHGPLQLLGSDGRPLVLPTGLTWVHLVDPDAQVAARA
jgi:Protein of unknown function (DUF3048) N-terminal domain/Protein of unknown function (DUF3048) C-terminal domain